MPKNFTFDYNGDLLRSKFIEKIGIIKSPLKYILLYADANPSALAKSSPKAKVTEPMSPPF
jgi:hypothetical protein